MVDYGLKDRVAIITGANNPQGIGATTALAFAREGAKVVLIYKRLFRAFDEKNIDKNGVVAEIGDNRNIGKMDIALEIDVSILLINGDGATIIVYNKIISDF